MNREKGSKEFRAQKLKALREENVSSLERLNEAFEKLLASENELRSPKTTTRTPKEASWQPNLSPLSVNGDQHADDQRNPSPVANNLQQRLQDQPRSGFDRRSPEAWSAANDKQPQMAGFHRFLNEHAQLSHAFTAWKTSKEARAGNPLLSIKWNLAGVKAADAGDIILAITTYLASLPVTHDGRLDVNSLSSSDGSLSPCWAEWNDAVEDALPTFFHHLVYCQAVSSSKANNNAASTGFVSKDQCSYGDDI